MVQVIMALALGEYRPSLFFMQKLSYQKSSWHGNILNTVKKNLLRKIGLEVIKISIKTDVSH